MRMRHPLVTEWELDWLMRWVKGEPSFGHDYQRKGDVERFFEWRNTLGLF